MNLLHIDHTTSTTNLTPYLSNPQQFFILYTYSKKTPPKNIKSTCTLLESLNVPPTQIIIFDLHGIIQKIARSLTRQLPDTAALPKGSPDKQAHNKAQRAQNLQVLKQIDAQATQLVADAISAKYQAKYIDLRTQTTS